MSLALTNRKAALLAPWNRNPLWSAARAVPSLDLRFAESKSLTDAASGQSLVTFTRASSGTYTDSQGVLRTATNDVPRFDHNPTTGESLGLLVEEQRTNLFLRSEQFDDAAWNSFAGSRSVTANSITAPDGTTTADGITADGTNNPHFVSQSVTVTNVAHSCSVFAKAGTSSTLAIRAFSALGGAFVFFNLGNGTVGTSGNVGVGSIVAYPNGWYRCIMNFTPLAATGSIGFYVDNTTNNTSSGTLHLWGAQLEVGAFPTSYIPTTSATATRSADVASITGTNFSSWYRQDEGTVFADVNSAPVNNIAQLTFDISEGAGNERMFQRRNTSGVVSTAVVDNGVTQGDIGSVVIGASARYRSGFAYKLNDLEIVVNGSGSAADTSATIPTPDRLHIGQNYASGQSCNGTLRRLTFWPSRLPSSTLQALTQ